jgi:hypothetical protein
MKKWFLGTLTVFLAISAITKDAEAQRGRRGSGSGRRADMNTIERPFPIADKVWDDHRCFARENVVLHEQDIIWRRHVAGHFCYSCGIETMS